MILIVTLIFLGKGFFLQDPAITQIVGVFQGKTLFIQNPYNPEDQSFCISEVRVNNKRLDISTRLSAIKLDFKELDQYTPVVIEVVHRDSTCKPVIINPDAISFHSTFSFREISVNDSSLVWNTTGDQLGGNYVIEKYQSGIWYTNGTVASQGTFEEGTYVYYPEFDEGPNKFRIKYEFPKDGKYLYSMEVDFHFYPEPVTFKPYNAVDSLILSRSASYEIYDRGSKLVLSGSGIVIDVSDLPRGDYVIYFNGTDPGVFKKQR